MKPTFVLILAALLMAACNNSNTEAESFAPPGWEELFNGTNLDGWETKGMLETEVKDGVLHVRASHPNNNAWVLTGESYQNFIFECEFQMPDTTANSGVAIRYDPSAEGIPNSIAYEANIDWRTGIQNNMGTLENAARANFLADPDKSAWHTMRIEANGDFLKVLVDGTKICETHNDRAKAGRIGLQVPINEGDEIAFRNMKIMKLPEETEMTPLVEEVYRNSERPMEPLLSDQSLEGWSTIGPGTWTFEGDVLHGYSGETPSFLCSDASYRNFYLKTQFKIKKEDNSGIFIRKHPDSTAVTITDAIECNIYDHNGYAHEYSTGSIATHARAWSNMIDYEGWNEMEIFARDRQIVLFINGKKSAESFLPESFDKSGQICLQAGTRIFSDNGPSDVYFKDMIIRAMD
jgi:hypothetical protein